MVLAGHRCERSSCPGSRAAACLLLPSRACQRLRGCCWAIVSRLLKPSWARWTLRAHCQPAHKLWPRLGCAGWHRASLRCLFPAVPRSAQERRGLFSPHRHISLPCTSFCGCFLSLPELGSVDTCRQPLPEVPGLSEPLRLSCAVGSSVSQRSLSGMML